MRFVVDMNLPPAWCKALELAGHTADHWSTIGTGREPDEVIMRWAHEHGAIVFSHDLDFSAMLASSGARAPSII
jgi:predicted nuclease of predicted toxin-antitoxin system